MANRLWLRGRLAAPTSTVVAFKAIDLGVKGSHFSTGRAPRRIVSSVNKKKFEQELRRLRRVRALSDGERVLFARSLTMTPDERWKTHEQFLRSHGLFTRSERKAFGFR